jgi:phosphoglycerate dehydrogenase-like enzyme
VAERLPLDDLLERSDVVSVHLRLSPASTGLLDRDRLARLRPGAVLVNTARGAIVDEQALVEALRGGRLAGAGLDVFATEPLPPDHPLRTAPNVVLTPHIGWKVEEVFTEWAEIAAEQLAAWLAGRLPRGGPGPGRRRGPPRPPWHPGRGLTREGQFAPDWWWRTRSTMLSRARGENGLVK